MSSLIAGTATAGRWLAGHIWTAVGRLVLIVFGFQLGWLAAVCLMDFTAKQFAFYDKATTIMQEANTTLSPEDPDKSLDLTTLSDKSH